MRVSPVVAPTTLESGTTPSTAYHQGTRHPKLRRAIAVLCALTFSSLTSAATEPFVERPDWQRFFAAEGVAGTLLVVDERRGTRWVVDRERAARRFVPASTFKVPHLLFALDAGVARDEWQRFAWDGTQHANVGWNADQTLRSSLRESVVWVYQGFARALGEARERTYLQRIDYGNADAGGGVERFWLDGALRVSALDQVAFLRRLHRNELPFAVEHQRLVKDLLIVGADRRRILRAKTGWSASVAPGIGWWVGYAEDRDGAVFFALNIDMPRGAEHLAARERIGRAVLAELDVLPAGSAP